MNFIEELTWRGMIHDIMQGTEGQLNKEVTTAYVGFDPTARSLTVGNLATLMLLVHLQYAGHQPIALIGGATAMIGDPAGKDKERQLLSEETIKDNEKAIEKELRKFLDFEHGKNAAIILNNKEWFKGMEFIPFLRDIGKLLPIGYMLSKESVKSRIEKGMSFTEFNYQILQAYDAYWLYANKDCKLQMGGSDQWGNITAGGELIRKKLRKEALGLTCPLITKADGIKFGKSEGGNIWLNPEMTSPYKFYQFWLNSSDEEAAKYIKIFTLLSRQEIEALEKEHAKAPHLRELQKVLAKDITIRVHSKDGYNMAIKASDILFGKATADTLRSISEKDLLTIFEGVPQVKVARTELKTGMNILDFLTNRTKIFPSKGEARRTISGGGLSINKQKIQDVDLNITDDHLLNNKYILVQKGKKNYYLVVTA